MTQASRKRKRSSRPARRRGGSSWSMLIIGLISGSVLAVLIQGVHEGNHYGFGSGLKTLFKREPPPAEPARPVQTDDTTDTPKPKLDFYTVLPRIERIVSDPVPPQRQASANGDEEAVYVLQVASYESFRDADRLKAQLTITGYDAAIQKVAIDDKLYYRVRLGPYKSRRRVKNVQQQLEEKGIRGMLLKITDPRPR